MQILVATLRGPAHQQQRAATYAALLPSLLFIYEASQTRCKVVDAQRCTNRLHLRYEHLCRKKNQTQLKVPILEKK